MPRPCLSRNWHANTPIMAFRNLRLKNKTDKLTCLVLIRISTIRPLLNNDHFYLLNSWIRIGQKVWLDFLQQQLRDQFQFTAN